MSQPKRVDESAASCHASIDRTKDVTRPMQPEMIISRLVRRRQARRAASVSYEAGSLRLRAPDSCESSLELVNAVGGLPRELFATEVTVGGGLTVDRTQQIKVLDHAEWAQVEDSRIASAMRSSGTDAVPKVSTYRPIGERGRSRMQAESRNAGQYPRPRRSWRPNGQHTSRNGQPSKDLFRRMRRLRGGPCHRRYRR